MAEVAASASAVRAVGRVGTQGSGGVTARQLVQILDLMGVISNESHAAGLMAEIGYAQTNGAATIYPARSLDQLAEHLSKDGAKVSLPGRAAYRASAGPTAVAAAPAAASNDYRRGGMPQPQAGMSVAARLKAEFDQHKQHLQKGIDKRKSPEYLEERARLAVRRNATTPTHFAPCCSTSTGKRECTFRWVFLRCGQDLARKEAPKTGYEISERAGTSRLTQIAKGITFLVIVAAAALLVARRRGVKLIDVLQARVRELLGRQ